MINTPGGRDTPFENPIQAIFAHNLDRGRGPRNISEYFWSGIRARVNANNLAGIKPSGLTQESLDLAKKGRTSQLLEKPLSQFLKDTDPFEVGLNSDKLRRILPGTEEYSVLKKSLGSSRGAALLDRLSSFGFTTEGGGVQAEYLWDEASNALFYGHQLSGGYVPIPISGKGPLGKNIINVGYSSYGSSGFRLGNKSHSAIDTIYTLLRKKSRSYYAAQESLSSIRKLKLPGYNVGGKRLKVASLLRAGKRFKGTDITTYTSMFGMLDVYNEVKAGTGVIQKSIGIYEEATAALNILLKTDRVGNFGSIALEGLTKVQAFDRLNKLLETSTQNISDYLYSNQSGNINDSYAYLKAEYLLGGDKNILLPNPSIIKAIYGDLPLHEGALKKGMFHMTKVGPVQRSQVTRLGKAAFPRYILNSWANIAERSGIENLALRGLPLTIGVLDTADEMASRLLTQEGGALLTPYGEKFLKQPVYSGQLIFGASDLAERANVENFLSKVTGKDISLASIKAQNLDVPINIRKSEIDHALNSNIKFGDLTEKEQAIRSLMLSKKRPHRYAGSLRNLVGHNISTVQFKGDSVVVNFQSPANEAIGAYELEVGARRATAVAPTTEHSLYNVAKLAGRHKVHMLVGKDEFLKMSPGISLLNTFFEHVSRLSNGKKIIEGITRSSGLNITAQGEFGTVTKNVPNIGSLKQAVVDIKNLLNAWQTGDDPEFRSLAERILKGEALNPEKFQEELTKAGVSGIRIFHTAGGMRADFMGDINLLRSQRFGVQKLLMMAAGTRLLGYDKPMDSPIYRMFYNAFSSRNKSQFRIDKDTLRLRFSDNAELKEILQKMSGVGIAVSDRRRKAMLNRDGTISMKVGSKLTTLDRLPSAESFRYSEAGGVLKSSLSNTILGQKTVFLDLGKSVKVRLGDKETHIRHLPIAPDYLSLDKTTSGRVVVGKKSPGHSLLLLLEEIESGVDPEKLAPAIGRYITDFTRRIPRQSKNRAGMLEKRTNILVSMATRVRLIPQRGDRFTRKGMADISKAFEVGVGSEEIYDYLARKETIDPEGARIIRDRLKKNGYVYSLLTADPTQRPEHQIVVKLFLDRLDKSNAKIGQLNLSMNPVLFRMFERDTDRDAIIAYFLEGMKGFNEKEVGQLYLKQQELLKPFLAWHNYELMNKGVVENLGDKAKEFMLSAGNVISGGRLAEYMAQKKEASTGYTIKRRLDDWINVLAFGTDDEVADMGIKSEAKALATQYRQSITKQKMGIVDAAFQAVYQSGVSKGKISGAKSMARTLLDISENAVKKGLTLEQVTDEATVAVKQFLSAESLDKRREIFAMAHALKLNGEEGFSAVDEILADLSRGADYNTISSKIDKMGDTVINTVSRIMGETLGVGYAIRSFIGRLPTNLVNQVRSKVSEKTDPLSLISKMVDSSEMAEGASKLGKEGVPSAASFSSIIDNLTKNKYAMGVGAAAATLAAIGIGLGTIDPQITPPVPMDTSQPTDYGPQVGPYVNNLKIDSSRPISLAARSDAYGNRSYGNVMQLNGAQSFVNLNIRDTRRVIHPYSLEGEARRAMNSDF